MDGRHDDDGRQSSLPRSLIPHLYRHPPLRHYDPAPLPRYPALDPPFVPDPPFPPASLRTPIALYRDFAPTPDRTSWSEGEAGPSSLVHHPPRDPRYRRTDSLSPRLAPHFDAFGRANAIFDQDLVRRDADRDPYLLLPGPPGHHHIQHTQPYTPHASHSSYHGSDLVLPSSSDADPDTQFSFRHDPYPSYPSMASLSLHTPPPHQRSFRSGSPEGSPYYRSDSYTDQFNSNDEGLPPEPRLGKRRRPQSAQESNDPRKNSAPRKTAVACNFCRGRKLRCNGAKPTCSHCTARKIKCEYVSTPKRRGPGKAPKGTRSKKADALRLDSSSTRSNNATAADRPSSSVLPTYELAAQAPEMHPYTHVMSLDTLDVFSFQPPAPAPRYLSVPDPELMREYYSRARSHRRQETSSEDWSGAERE